MSPKAKGYLRDVIGLSDEVIGIFGSLRGRHASFAEIFNSHIEYREDKRLCFDVQTLLALAERYEPEKLKAAADVPAVKNVLINVTETAKQKFHDGLPEQSNVLTFESKQVLREVLGVGEGIINVFDRARGTVAYAAKALNQAVKKDDPTMIVSKVQQLFYQNARREGAKLSALGFRLADFKVVDKRIQAAFGRAGEQSEALRRELREKSPYEDQIRNLWGKANLDEAGKLAESADIWVQQEMEKQFAESALRFSERCAHTSPAATVERIRLSPMLPDMPSKVLSKIIRSAPMLSGFVHEASPGFSRFQEKIETLDGTKNADQGNAR